MNTDNKTIFNFYLLGKFGKDMYDTLVYKHHLSNTTPKLIEWKDALTDPVRGFELVKENIRYILMMEENTEVLEKLLNVTRKIIKLCS
jgi:hypothetical protein